MSTTATESVRATAEHARQSAEGFAEAMSSWTSTWMNAWKHNAESMLRANGAVPGPVTADEVAPAFRHSMDEMRRQASTTFRGLADLTAANVAELAAMGAEHARFLARLSERGFDCVFGPQPARSNETLNATMRDMQQDVLEHGSAFGERLVRLNTRGVERVAELMGRPLSSCCGGTECGSTRKSAVNGAAR